MTEPKKTGAAPLLDEDVPKLTSSLLATSSKKNRLRNKIFIRIIAISVLPLTIAAATSLYITNLSHSHSIANIEDTLLGQKIEEINALIGGIAGAFELRVGFSQRAPIAREDQQFILTQLLGEFSVIEEVSFLNVLDPQVPLGQETARYNRISVDGATKNELQPQGAQEKFTAALTGKSYVGTAHLTLKGPVITIASPVYNGNGEIINVLTGDINLSQVQKSLEQTQLGNSGYVYVVSHEGELLAHSLQSVDAFDRVHSIPMISSILSGTSYKDLEGQHRYTSAWGEPVIATGQFIPELGWGIIAEWPANDANAFVNIIRIQFIFLIALVLLLTAIMSVLITNKIVRPIEELERASKYVATGKFDRPADVTTGDEIEDLAKEFNKMILGLKRLDELREEFVFIAAHELRTPVTAIKGYVQMVLEGATGKLNDKTRDFLTKVDASNKRLVALVNDLLEVARSDAGKLTIDVSAIGIKEPISEVLSELGSLASKKAIPLVYEPPGDLPSVLADTARLKEVMVNLVGNAIKYTLTSGKIVISHEISENALVTHIKDGGIGMSTQAQEKLFQKYYRVQTQQTQNITGTGLGLFIVKQIIEKMRGTIWVESEEGKGSTFSFSLPISNK